MLRHARRRPQIHPQICAAALALFLILLSLSVLHSRLSSSSIPLIPSNQLQFFDDATNDAFDGFVDDPIDESDNYNSIDRPHQEDDNDDDENVNEAIQTTPASGLFWDHVFTTARRSFGKPEKFLLPDETEFNGKFDGGRLEFGSDDEPVDEEVRVKLNSVRRIEDALLLKSGNGGGESLVRVGWVKWLEAKADFIRRDHMLRGNLEVLNPKNHPLLQDPDGPWLTALTRGDRLLQKALIREIEKTPFNGKSLKVVAIDGKDVKTARELKSTYSNLKDPKGNGKEKVVDEIKRIDGWRTLDSDSMKAVATNHKVVKEEEHVYADGQRWGYYPGLDPRLSFSEFMRQFLGGERCRMRVFMVWNSPAWMYTVRHQRSLESLLYHHKHACVVMFSETMELDFFKDFVQDGFKVAVAMPNLDELLKNTPTHVFASVWYNWRKTKYYSIHYSELVRLAALYKYGGIYLDSDVIVLNSLQNLTNSIGIEDRMGGGPIYNGAVMSFKRSSPFIRECLNEFYSTYNDELLRWNGAELVTRVLSRLFSVGNPTRALYMNIEPQESFFPISSQNITRYFFTADDAIERASDDLLLKKIQHDSLTFHFWNSLTSTSVPEPESVAGRLIDLYCIRCIDAL